MLFIVYWHKKRRKRKRKKKENVPDGWSAEHQTAYRFTVFSGTLITPAIGRRRLLHNLYTQRIHSTQNFSSSSPYCGNLSTSGKIPQQCSWGIGYCFSCSRSTSGEGLKDTTLKNRKVLREGRWMLRMKSSTQRAVVTSNLWRFHMVQTTHTQYGGGQRSPRFKSGNVAV